MTDITIETRRFSSRNGRKVTGTNGIKGNEEQNL